MSRDISRARRRVEMSIRYTCKAASVNSKPASAAMPMPACLEMRSCHDSGATSARARKRTKSEATGRLTSRSRSPSAAGGGALASCSETCSRKPRSGACTSRSCCASKGAITQPCPGAATRTASSQARSCKGAEGMAHSTRGCDAGARRRQSTTTRARSSSRSSRPDSMSASRSWGRSTVTPEADQVLLSLPDKRVCSLVQWATWSSSIWR